MLQQEKNIRTQVEALIKEKARRMQQLKALLEQDQDLCDVLCSVPYGIAPDSVPSLETLDNFHQHIANQNEERVGAHSSNHTSNRTLMWLHEEKLWDEHCYKQERCHWTGWDQSGCSTVWWAGFVSSSLLCHILTASCFQVKRHAEFTELKKQIILYMEELDRVPETSFEKDVVCEDEDSFCLSRDNITSLKLLLCQVSRIFFFFCINRHFSPTCWVANWCCVDLAAWGTQGRERGHVWESQREDPAAVGQTAGSTGGKGGFQPTHGHVQEEEFGRGEKMLQIIFPVLCGQLWVPVLWLLFFRVVWSLFVLLSYKQKSSVSRSSNCRTSAMS